MQHDDHQGNHHVLFRIHRRRLLQSSGVVANSALVGATFFPDRTLAGADTLGRGTLLPAPAPHATTPLQEDAPPPALSAEEMTILKAAVGRLIPTDELGPGADEAGVHIFINRGLVWRGLPGA